MHTSALRGLLPALFLLAIPAQAQSDLVGQLAPMPIGQSGLYWLKLDLDLQPDWTVSGPQDLPISLEFPSAPLRTTTHTLLIDHESLRQLDCRIVGDTPWVDVVRRHRRDAVDPAAIPESPTYVLVLAVALFAGTMMRRRSCSSAVYAAALTADAEAGQS